MNNIRAWLGALFCTFLFAVNAYSANPWIEGTATEVVDGDTVKIQLDMDIPRFGFRWDFGEDADNMQSVQLSQIDAPELKQPYGPEAKKSVTQKILNKKVRITEEGDRGTPGLTSARLWYLGDNGKWVDLNKVIVSEGLAWVGRFSNDDELKALELESQKASRGLFKDSKPMPPWIYRDKREGVKHKVFSRKQCLDSKPCRKMQSCSEAMAYLQNCARSDLDPNGDGIPCESSVCGQGVQMEKKFDTENDD